MSVTAPALRPGLTPGAVLRALLARRGAIVAPVGREGLGDLAVIRETRRRTPLLMPDAAALHILLCVRAVRHLPGAMAEAGVLAGGSARLICEAKHDGTELHLFDVFEALQGAGGGPDAEEIRGHFGQVHGRREAVERLLEPYPGVRLHPGVFPGSARGLEHERFSFVHLDMDLGSSTRAGLDFFHPRLLAGAILVGDDYALPEVRAAFAAYFQGRPDTVIPLPWNQVMVVKQG